MRDNINKLWQYNYYTNKFHKKNQGDIINPKVGHIYVYPITETHMNVYFLTIKVPYYANETNSYADDDSIIEYYYCQITIGRHGLRINAFGHEADYWDRRFKGNSNLFLYKDVFEFMNWDENPLEVKS